MVNELKEAYAIRVGRHTGECRFASASVDGLGYWFPLSEMSAEEWARHRKQLTISYPQTRLQKQLQKQHRTHPRLLVMWGERPTDLFGCVPSWYGIFHFGGPTHTTNPKGDQDWKGVKGETPAPGLSSTTKPIQKETLMTMKYWW